MIPAKFDYYAPTTLSEAISLLDQHGYDAKIIAGGQSLIPAMRFRLAQPAVLIDINRIDGLEYIREEDGYLAIGAFIFGMTNLCIVYAGWDPNWFRAFLGVMLLLAVMVNLYVKRLSTANAPTCAIDSPNGA